MRYTAVFEFPLGEAPKVSANDGWLGGKICAVQFYDALQEIEVLNAEIERLRNQADNDICTIMELKEKLAKENK
jgi:hypothetical protein